ncbi:MAG TPA: hypothetical protein VIK33_03415 [Anaerolineae bacterium]
MTSVICAEPPAVYSIGIVSDTIPFEFDRQRRLTDIGTLILSRFLAMRPGSLHIENVESDRDFQRRDIDLIWHRAIRGWERTTVEIKCDAHAGDDEALIRSARHPYYARRTDNFALETVSNDVSGSPGWVFASEADVLLYYFAAIPRTIDEIEEWWALGEEYLLATLGIVSDRLYVIDLPELRRWFEAVQGNYREVAAQNDTYRTLSRLVPCDDVVEAIRHCHVVTDVYRAVTIAFGLPRY